MRHGIPNLGALQAFEATARLGSFSRAAEELSLTHSAVYRQVTGLEERLGVQLLTRVRRRVGLTPAGIEYAGRVRHHLEQLEKDTFGLISRSALGRSLHIAVLPTLATTWLVPKLADFQQAHPDITVSLSVRTLPFQFADHPFDAAIYHATQLWSQTAGIKLFDEREMVPVCLPALLDESQTPGKTAKAASETSTAAMHGAAPGHTGTGAALDHMLHLHMSSRPDAWRRWYQTQGLDYTPAIHAGPRYELFSMTLAAVRAGMGIALCPRFLVADDLASGALITPHPGVLPVREAYFFSYPVLTEPSEPVLAFQAWLQTISRPYAAQ